MIRVRCTGRQMGTLSIGLHLRSAILRASSYLGLLSLSALSSGSVQLQPVRHPVALIRQAGKPLSTEDLDILKGLNAEQKKRVSRGGKFQMLDLPGRVAILIDRSIPILADLQVATQLAKAFQSSGQAKNFGQLSDLEQAAVAQVIERIGVSVQPPDANAQVSLAAEASYSFTVQGKTVRLSVPLKNGLLSARDARRMAEVPFLPSQGPRVPSASEAITPHKRDSIEIVFSPWFGDPIAKIESAEHGMKWLSEQNREEELKRQVALKTHLDRILSENRELLSQVPHDAMDEKQLSPILKDQLRSSFVESFRANGFTSLGEAEAAWNSAIFNGGAISFGLQFALQRSGSQASSTVVVFTGSGQRG